MLDKLLLIISREVHTWGALTFRYMRALICTMTSCFNRFGEWAICFNLISKNISQVYFQHNCINIRWMFKQKENKLKIK